MESYVYINLSDSFEQIDAITSDTVGRDDVFCYEWNIPQIKKYDIMEKFKHIDDLTIKTAEAFASSEKNAKTKFDKLLQRVHDDKVVSFTRTIRICGDLEEINEFIKLNPELNNYKIIVCPPTYTETSEEICNECIKKLNHLDNIYFFATDNTDPVKVLDYQMAIDYINSIVKHVKELNLSPLEQTMYVYDFVRKRVYTEENNEEKYSTSRDLVSIVLGNKIVCQGYARLFNCILTKLGFKTTEQYVRKPKKEVGHARSAVYIQDDKYHLEGIYLFDPTWDSKTSEDDLNYLHSYKYFALTKEQMKAFESQEIDETFGNFGLNKARSVVRTIQESGVHNVSELNINIINNISRLVYEHSLIKPLMAISPELLSTMPPRLQEEAKITSQEEVIDNIKYFYSLIDAPISDDKKLQALLTVRKYEYYENPEEFSYDFNLLCEIVFRSHWQIISKEERLLASLFGQNYIAKKDQKSITQSVYDALDKQELKNIEIIRLTRTLRTYLDKEKRN